MNYRFICGSTVAAGLVLSLLPATITQAATASTKPAPGATAKTATKNPVPKVEMLYATGEGAMANAKEQPNRAKAYLEAKAYAKMAAIASLVQLAKGTIIEYSARGEGYVADAVVKQEIKGVLDSVQVVSVAKRSVEKDILVAVTVRAPKPLPPKSSPTPKEPAKTVPVPFQPSWIANSTQSAPKAADGYTSLIVDAQGLGVCRSMSPRILRADGSEVWGTVKSDYDFVSEYGIVGYANSRADACQSRRAGERPLVVRAIRCGNATAEGDVIISSADAQLIEEANRKTRFLDDYRVVIVVDRVSSFAGLKGGAARK